jgi:galactoside O-acetyltransferase
MIGWNEEIKKELGYCGNNVMIGHNVIFTNPKKVILGDNVRIDPFCLITTELEVGSYAQICSHAVLGGGSQHKITLGKWNFIGYGSKLFCASEDYSGEFGPVNEYWGGNRIFRGDITFKDFSGIASDVMVLPGVSFPEGCTIGAKSFVYSNIELKEWSIYIGNPLLFHKNRNKENIIKFSNDENFLKERL